MKTWKKFARVNARTLEAAAALIRKRNASIIAGCTDLLAVLRKNVLSDLMLQFSRVDIHDAVHQEQTW
jgi:hypothetical protein